jgi:putative mRNA 3-end processing factor
MLVRGTRRRRGVDRGLVLSDHADWPGLLAAIEATGCQRVLATHGHTAVLVRHLRARGYEADSLHTEFLGEGDDGDQDTPETPAEPTVAESAGESS